MLKIWGRANSINVQKVLWCADELGLAYERIDAGMEYGVVGTPEYRALNPNGLVPTIEDDGFSLWESNTIVRYLAARHGSGTLWPADPAARADSEKWMDWQIATLWPRLRPVFWGLVRTPAEKRNAEEIEASRKQTAECFAIVDGALKGRAFLGGNTLTIGDISVGVCAQRWFNLPVERAPAPNLEAWYRRLQERKPFQAWVDKPLT
jgi:glutathione S-transferase